MSNTFESLRNSAKGVLYGQALGDAIGLATEYMTLQEIEEKYYNNGIDLSTNFNFDQIVQDYHRSTWKKRGLD